MSLDSQLNDLVNSMSLMGSALAGELGSLSDQIGAIGNGGALQGAYKNLRNTCAPNSADVNISADELGVLSADGTRLTARAVEATATVGGFGLNGLDTGAWTPNTWYALWVVYNKGSQASGGLFSLSAVAPIKPPNFAYAARVGWVLTDSTGTKPLSFIQQGNYVTLTISAAGNVQGIPLIGTGAAGDVTDPTWVPLPWAAFAPPTTARLLLVPVGEIASTMIVAPNNNYGSWDSPIKPPPLVWMMESTAFNAYQEMLVESANIYWANNAGAPSTGAADTGATSMLGVAGWIDNI